MNTKGKHQALVTGDARLYLKAAEILDALDAGTPLSEIKIPPGITIEPTQAEFEASCREIGVEPPAWPLPPNGWRSPVFMSVQVPTSWLGLPISMVASATETKTYPTTFGEVLEGIRAGKWEKIVKRVQERYAKAFKAAEEEGKPDPAAAAKKAANSHKLKMPAVTWSGAFTERADSAIVTHSGFLCIDADNCEEPTATRAKLANDPYVQAAFISPTGTGCKALVRIPADASTHAGAFVAARRHFKEAHGIAIDEACKNLSRLCFVAHDPGAFIRGEDARLLEPVPEERAEAPKVAAKAARELEGLMFLPKTEFTTYSASAESIFKRIAERQPPEMFIRGRSVVTIEKTAAESGAISLDITDTDANAFRAKAERYGTLFEWQAGGAVLKPGALMSVDTANVLLASDERLRLPPLAMVHQCPLLVERDGKPAVLPYGYHPELGGRYVTSKAVARLMPLAEAVAGLLALIEEFPFATLADKARAVAAIVTPALRFGGLLRCHFPVVMVEADRPQAGKGTLVEAIQRFYGEVCELTGKRKGGVGSFDEDLSRQMLRGRPFIPIDNIRASLDSEFFEHALTCPLGTTVSARVPHKAAVSVDPNRHIFHLTSNKFESTQDLAARSCVIRLQKRDDYKWKKFGDGLELLAHLEADFATSVSVIYSIAAQWVARGKPRNEDELRGEGRFRQWWQVADWIAQNMFNLPSPLDGHEKIQRRVASAGQSWARAIGNVLKAQGMLGVELSATQLVEIADEADEDANAKIPGAAEKADENDKAKRVGSIMAQLFKAGAKIEIDLYRITRIERQEERPAPHYDTLVRKYYVFQLIGGQG